MAPDSLVLRPSGLRSWALILGSAVFVFGGVVMMRDGKPIGLWAIAFFGLCLLVGILNAIPSASELRLDRGGFVVRTLFRTRSYRWADVTNFQIVSIPGRVLVAFTLRADPARERRKTGLFGNFDAALPDSYGLSAVALVALLEDWKAGKPRAAEPREGASGLLQALADSARSGGGLLAVKLAALFSFCGGPLYLSDVLDIKHSGVVYFAIPISPIVLLLFGALALRDEDIDRLGRLSIEGGLVGAALLTAVNIYAALELFGAPPRPDGGLIAFGMAVGWCTAFVYTVMAVPYLRRTARSRP